MIEPLLSDDAFLADVAAARGQPGALHLWWLGQSGFLLQWQGKHLLLDPYLSDSLTKKYAGTDKPHVRMTRRVVAPERLDFIDVATSSHNHTDHLDAETLKPLLSANPDMKLVAPEANRAFVAQRLGVDSAELLGCDDGETLSVCGFEITGIPAAHETIERVNGHCMYLGYRISVGDWSIYHSGDTVLYEGLAERISAPKKLLLALLPINGAKPERRVAGNLSGVEAAHLARDMGAQLVIPCHYEMFEFNTAKPDEFVRECERIGQPYRVLRAGERVSLI
jgi:L-ascorbate metabolism protein UlaG (beta-lactamase superfamily)